jgi:hypothetical protein
MLFAFLDKILNQFLIFFLKSSLVFLFKLVVLNL